MNHNQPVEYTCSMHPEVIQNGPGTCPKCGMFLEPRESPADSTNNETQVEYTCSMHPEVIQNGPGSCPKCGMFLEPRESPADSTNNETQVEYTCSMHPEVIQNGPGSCPKCGMFLEPRESPADSTNNETQVEYTCSMHPEVIQNGPGSCPKCGMFLEPRESLADTSHEQHKIDHGADEAFMSMVDVTKDLPRSEDGLPMDWIDVAFGPFFPGLPSGLLLTLTLDGDTVAASSAQTLVENTDLLQDSAMDRESFIERLADMQPLSPLSYRHLACRAMENAASVKVSTAIANARVGALERERISSHLGWLALFGQQIGCDWLQQSAATLQLKCQQADLKEILALTPDIENLSRRLQRMPLLKSRTAAFGQLKHKDLRGPVARAAGISNDARSTDPTYAALGFKMVTGEKGDSLSRLHIRLNEISHSLKLIEAAGDIASPVLPVFSEITASGEAMVETPRGLAHLQLTLKQGQVISAKLDTPSARHLSLVDTLIKQQSLGDALLAVGSLDLSPWELQQ